MGKPIRVKGAGRLRNKEVIPFTRQLASMLGAGMTILASIQTLGEQCAALQSAQSAADNQDVVHLPTSGAARCSRRAERRS